jgi:endonuclease/exonuclease/phosphatase (EEP) superfamily protein YafD
VLLVAKGKSRSHGESRVWLSGLVIAYGVWLAVISGLNWLGADRWWPGAFNLYLPQVIWLAPIVPLLVLSRRGRRLTWVLCLYILWVCGPIMGFHWHLRSPWEAVAGDPTIRLMTCNVKDGHRDIRALMRDLDQYKPDVVLFQDAGNGIQGLLGRGFHGWNVRSYGQYVIASRWPLTEAEVIPLSPPGEGDCILRTVMQIGSARIALYNVHLLTPRDGLNALRVVRRRPGRFTGAILDLRENVERRLLQADQVAELVRQEQGPTILAGDLNSPEGSLACKRMVAAGLHDAFAEGGRGYGYTYGHDLLLSRFPWLPRLSWMRIDHIMLSPGIRASRCWTGTREASDHRPVYADLLVSASR